MTKLFFNMLTLIAILAGPVFLFTILTYDWLFDAIEWIVENWFAIILIGSIPVASIIANK